MGVAASYSFSRTARTRDSDRFNSAKLMKPFTKQRLACRPRAIHSGASEGGNVKVAALLERETAIRNDRQGAKEQENQSRSKDRYLSRDEVLKSLQTKQLTTGESCSHWSYTFSQQLKSTTRGRGDKGDSATWRDLFRNRSVKEQKD